MGITVTTVVLVHGKCCRLGQDGCILLAAFARAPAEPYWKWMSFWRNFCPGLKNPNKLKQTTKPNQKPTKQKQTTKKHKPKQITNPQPNQTTTENQTKKPTSCTSLPSDSSCFAAPTLASEGLLSYWVLLSMQFTTGVWKNPFKLSSCVTDTNTCKKKQHSGAYLLDLLCCHPGQAALRCFCNFEVEEQHCRGHSPEQKQDKGIQLFRDSAWSLWANPLRLQNQWPKSLKNKSLANWGLLPVSQSTGGTFCSGGS